MALCLTSFNHYLGRRRPRLLLLDELDAVLHPSMVAALVATLKSLFVQHGTKVLMTSHAAMTVAALDENDIFRVVRSDGHVSVSRATRAEAISELSEGLATVDAGLRIAAYDAAKVTILTEGHNARHLRRWVELNFPQDVHVFEDLAEHRSDGELLSYGRLLVRMTTNTHFVHRLGLRRRGEGGGLASGAARGGPRSRRSRSGGERTTRLPAGASRMPMTRSFLSHSRSRSTTARTGFWGASSRRTGRPSSQTMSCERGRSSTSLTSRTCTVS